MPSADEVADFALVLAAEAAEKLHAFASGDGDLIEQAEMTLLGRRTADPSGGGKTWPGQPGAWGQFQAAFDLLVGLGDRKGRTLD